MLGEPRLCAEARDATRRAQLWLATGWLKLLSMAVNWSRMVVG
jgi:hypothetical protein